MKSRSVFVFTLYFDNSIWITHFVIYGTPETEWRDTYEYMKMYSNIVKLFVRAR
jgi:hypothetical protein